MGLLGLLLIGTCAIASSSAALSLNFTFLVYFDYDNSIPNSKGRAAIADALVEVKGRSWTTTITIVGHTDRSGDEQYNLQLSRRRAETVRDILLAAGVAPDSVYLAWRGESEPAVPTPDGVRKQANRRVELTLQ